MEQKGIILLLTCCFSTSNYLVYVNSESYVMNFLFLTQDMKNILSMKDDKYIRIILEYPGDHRFIFELVCHKLHQLTKIELQLAVVSIAGAYTTVDISGYTYLLGDLKNLDTFDSIQPKKLVILRITPKLCLIEYLHVRDYIQ